VRGSGGVRKLRWARQGTGKRDRLCIIYCVRAERSEFWMRTLYAKTKRENAPAHIRVAELHPEVLREIAA
jgi:hypothetical protein